MHKGYQLRLDSLMGLAVTGSTNRSSWDWNHYWDQLWLDPLIKPIVAGSTKGTTSDGLIHYSHYRGGGLCWLSSLKGPVLVGSTKRTKTSRIHLWDQYWQNPLTMLGVSTSFSFRPVYDHPCMYLVMLWIFRSWLMRFSYQHYHQR